MKKILNIALKDIFLNFRDPMGLVIMLVAPLALTLVIAAALGGTGGSSPALSDIPVALVNYDTGSLSPYFIEAFSSEELADLLEPVVMTDEAQAMQLLANDEIASVVIIPANFSESILPAGLAAGQTLPPAESSPSTVMVHANPSRTISSNIIRSVVDEILNRFISGRVSSQLTIQQLILSGRLSPTEAASYGQSIGPSLSQAEPNQQITLRTTVLDEAQDNEFSWLEYSAPSMAILFLMFTLSNAGRSLLAERDGGTLPRMLVSPSSRAQIVAGKMLGNYFTGLLQMSILFVAGHFLFKISWGNPLAVTLLTLALVAAITGWGMLPAVVSRTPGQASAIGTAITLTFSALSGTFVPRGALPNWLQGLSLVTPNAWGNEWYYRLINGASLNEVLPAVLVLLAMATVLFAIASIAFRRMYR